MFEFKFGIKGPQTTINTVKSLKCAASCANMVNSVYETDHRTMKDLLLAISTTCISSTPHVIPFRPVLS